MRPSPIAWPAVAVAVVEALAVPGCFSPRFGACAVTCGEAGSWWLTRDGAFHVAAPAVDAVDTLGAGDVFHGAYALAIANGRAIADAARFATHAAALKCTRDGGRAGAPTLDEVRAFATKLGSDTISPN
jgi:sugar/nucleoside kinase (ribokinase family)